MTAHSPEPWSTENRGLIGDPAIWSTVDTVCGIFDPRQLSESDPAASDEPSMADARRIVACVNTCAGISTEGLEDAATMKTIERLCHLAKIGRDVAWDIRGAEIRGETP